MAKERSRSSRPPAPDRTSCVRIRQRVAVAGLAAELAERPEVWFMMMSRQRVMPAYRDTQSVFAFTRLFPAIRKVIERIAKGARARLENPEILRIYPRSRIYARGEASQGPLPTQSHVLVLAGSIRIENRGDAVRIEVGEVWRLGPDASRELCNDGDDWAVFVTFDLAPAPADAAPEPPVPSAPSQFPAPWDLDGDARCRREALRCEIVARGRIRTTPTGPIISPTGDPIDWLIDLRRIFLDPAQLEAVCDLFWDRFAPQLPFQIAGMEVAAVPLIVGLLGRARQRGLNVNGALIRKERKTNGLGRAIEGELTSDPLFLVDDTFNSGNAAEKARVTLAHAGRRVEQFFSVVDFGSDEGRAWCTAHGIARHALFTLADLGLSPPPPRKAPTRIFWPAWRYRPNTGYAFHVVPKSAPLYVDGRLYFGGDDGSVHAVDAKRGALIWRRRFPSPTIKGIWSSIAERDGRLYFGAYNGNLYCLSAGDGSTIWQVLACEWIGSSPLLLPDKDLVVVGLEYARPSAQGAVAAFRMSSGEKVWEVPLMRLQHGSCAHVRSRDLVVTGSADHEVIALEADTGRVRWRSPMRRSAKYAPVVDEDRGIVVVASFDGSIYVLDAVDGRRHAEFPTDDFLYTTPLITHGRIFCGSSDGHLYVVDLERLELERRIPLFGRVFASPRLVDGSVIVGTTGGVVRELDPETLEVRGAFTLPDAVTSAVAATADGGRIFAITYMNELYAYDRIIRAGHVTSSTP